MESALIVSDTEKSIDFFTEMLNFASINQITIIKSCGEARRMLLEKDFDLVVINSPLRDETGESLSRHIASKGISQVILVVKSEYFDEVSVQTEDSGVLTISKPVDRAIFWYALKLAKSASLMFRRIQAENSIVKQKIENIRIIDRAKSILINHLNMNEQEAHRYIEKQAMDKRVTKREIAEKVLRTFEN